MTPELLKQCWNCNDQIAQRFAEPLTRAMIQYGINTLQRRAAFLAQVGHESRCGRYVREIWGPTPAQEMYEGKEKLGNTEAGDGKRFMGRGLIQITGRYNYGECGRALNLDLLAHPELLETDESAARSAAWFWHTHNCNALADQGDFTALTRRINGGLNGLQDRITLHKRATAALIRAGNTDAATDPDTQTAAPIVEAGQMADPIEVAETIAERNPMPTKSSSTFSDIGKTVGGAVSFANPFLGAAISALSGLIPEVAKLFPPGSEVAQRNVALATAVVDHVTQAVGAANAQEAVQRIAEDPAAAQSAQQAVQAAWFDLQEAGGGGIDGARKFVAENPQMADVLRLVTISALSFLAFANIAIFAGLLASVIAGSDVTRDLMQMATIALQADIGAALTAIGFWLGSSFGSNKKTDLLAK